MCFEGQAHSSNKLLEKNIFPIVKSIVDCHISLHSGGFYNKNEEGKIKCESLAVLFDDLTHDAIAVWALLQPILTRIKMSLPIVKTQKNVTLPE